MPRFFSIRSISMKLYRFLQHFLTGKFVHYFVLFFISISIAAVIASSYESMADYRIGLFAITYASSFVFLVEFVARIFSAPAQYPALSRNRARLRYLFSFYGFVDFVAILPCVLSYFYWDTPTVHVIILPYIFIIFKLIRHSRSFQLIGKALASVKEELATAYTACFIMVCFSAILMYYLERSAQPEVFRNIGDGVWWSIVTFATVGYGDIYPRDAPRKAPRRTDSSDRHRHDCHPYGYHQFVVYAHLAAEGTEGLAGGKEGGKGGKKGLKQDKGTKR